MRRLSCSLSAAAAALFVLLAPACLDLGEAVPVRLFEPARSTSEAAASAGTLASPIELGPVRAQAPIDLAMVWRVSPVELTKDEANRWAAAPAAFVEARLRAALLPAAGVLKGTGALEVRVLAFEGQRGAPPRARVELEATLVRSTGERSSARHAGTAELTGVTPEALARGMGPALDEAIAGLVAWLVGALG